VVVDCAEKWPEESGLLEIDDDDVVLGIL